MATWRPWDIVPDDNCVLEPGIIDVDECDEVNPIVQPQIAGRGHHMTKGQKAAVLAMYEYATSNGAKNPVSDVVKVLGVSPSSVYKLRGKEIRSPKKRGPSPGQLKFRRVDEFHFKMVQREIYEAYTNNVVPTLDQIHKKILERDPEFNYSVSTLRKMVVELGFKFKKLDRRGRVMMSQRIVFLRDKYLRQIKQLRAQKKKLIFLDETW